MTHPKSNLSKTKITVNKTKTKNKRINKLELTVRLHENPISIFFHTSYKNFLLFFLVIGDNHYQYHQLMDFKTAPQKVSKIKKELY